MKNLIKQLLLLAVFTSCLFAPFAGAQPELNTNGKVHTINYVDTLPIDFIIPTNSTNGELVDDFLEFKLKGGDGGKNNHCDSQGGRGATAGFVFPIGTGPNDLQPGGTLRFITGRRGRNQPGIDGDGGGGGGGGTAVLYHHPGAIISGDLPSLDFFQADSKWVLLGVAGGGGGGFAQVEAFGYCDDINFGEEGRRVPTGGSAGYAAGGTGGFGGAGFGTKGGGGGGYQGSGGGHDVMGGRKGGIMGGNGGEDPDANGINEGGWGYGGGGAGIRGGSAAGGGGGGFSGGATNQVSGGGGGGSWVTNFVGVYTYIIENGTTLSPQHGYVEYAFRSTSGPFVKCRDIEVNLGELFYPSDLLDWFRVEPGETYNLQVPGHLLGFPLFFPLCDEIGPQSVTLILGSTSGASTSCTATVTVKPPVEVSCTDLPITGTVGVNSPFTPAIDLVGSVTQDACGSVIDTWLSPAEFTCGDIGSSNEVTFNALDEAGFVTSCTASVTLLEEASSEYLVCPSNKFVSTDPDDCVKLITDELIPDWSGICGNLSYQIVTPSSTINGTGEIINQEFPIGVSYITYTLTGSDNSTTSCAFNVGVGDNQAPVAQCQDITVQAGQVIADMAVLIDDGSYDNCSISSLVASSSSFGCSDIGEQNVTLIVFDEEGNGSACTAVVTVEDNGFPSSITCPANITTTVDAGECSKIVSSGLSPTWSGSCFPDLTYEISPPPANGLPTIPVSGSGEITNYEFLANTSTIVYTLTNPDNSTASCSFTVTVEDNEIPVANCKNITIQAGEIIIPAFFVNQIDDGSTDNCNIASRTASQTSFGCADLGDTPVTLTVTDNSGNSNTCISIVTVEDNTAPSAICQDITIALDASGLASITGNDINGGSSDFCGIVSATASPNAFDCTNLGPNAVTLTVTDNNGNSSGCVATVTVEDIMAPTAVCQDVTVYLSNPFVHFSQVDAGSVDNCTDQSDLNFYLLDPISGSPGQTSSIYPCIEATEVEIQLDVFDEFSKKGSCTATVTLVDDLAPTALCEDITVQLDEDGLASITKNDIDAGSSDDCGIASRTLSNKSFDCTDVGLNTVTLTITNNSGNSSSCDATVTVEDHVAPVALCQDITVALDDDGLASITASDIDGGSSDACGIQSVTMSIGGAPVDGITINYNCDFIGDQSVELIITDANGNSSSCNATVTVEDPFAPVALCQDITVALDDDGLASFTASDIDAGSSDDCGIQSLSVAPNSFGCGDLGDNSVTLNVVDNNGNSSTCSAYVTVEDNTPPVLVCQDITVHLDASGNANFSPEDLVVSVSDNCQLLPLSLPPVSLNCGFLGSFSAVYATVDESGNGSSCTQTVTIVDAIAPVALCQDITVALDDDGLASITASDIDGGSSDACGIAGLALDRMDFSCDDLNLDDELYPGENPVILTVTDNNGNSSTCNAVVKVEDNTPPVLVCEDVTVHLDASGFGSFSESDLVVSVSDNCQLSPEFINSTAISCDGVGSFSATYTRLDPSGNESSCTQTVTVVDAIAPVALCQDITVALDEDGLGSFTADDIDAGSSDACGILSKTFIMDGELVDAASIYFDCDFIAGQAVSLIVTDVHGNSSSCDATITPEDHVAPIALCQNITVNLDDDGLASISESDIDAGSSDVCGITSLALDRTDFSCDDIGPAGTVILTVTDNNGNSSTCNATVKVKDITPPVLVCQDVTVHLDDSGNANFSPEDLVVSLSDNCQFPPPSEGYKNISLDCGDVGSFSSTYARSDGSNNNSSCTQTVTVVDAIAPMALCQDITLELDEDGLGSFTADDIDGGSSDACGIDSRSLSQTSFSCTYVGSNTVTMTVTDVHGNSSSCNATVTIEEEIAPEALCQDITVQLDNDGMAAISVSDIDAGSSDACGIDSQTLSDSSFGCADVGSNTVTITVTDVNGNSSSCNATVTVEDNVDPIAVCQDIEVFLDQSGNATITADDVDNGSSDACGIQSSSVSPNTFGTANAGDNSVTLSVTDVNGNSASCSATVTILLRPTELTYTGDLEVQYSDPVSLSATLTDWISGDPIAGMTIYFTIGSQNTSAVTDASGVAATTMIITQPPSVLGYSYDVVTEYAGDAIYLPASDSDAFDLLQEDARAYFTGSPFVSTGGSNSDEAIVLLTATIKDISAVPGDPDTDAYPGEITNALVNFIDRDNPMDPINPTPLSVSPIDATTGTVLYQWPVDLNNSDAEEFNIGIEVLNYYTRNAAAEDAVVNVYKPLNDFVTGGGYLILTDQSEGMIAGDAGTKCNFGFNIKFNPAGTNLKGRVRVLVRRTEADGILHTYQIKGNKMNSLSVDGSTGYALFTGKANIQDVTDPNNPTSISGNNIFQIEMTDNGEPGNTDLISFSLYSNSGTLWFSSNWDGTDSAPQLLGGGNLVVHTGGSSNLTTPDSGIEATYEEKPLSQLETATELDIYPNPFGHSTTIRYQLPEGGPTTLEIYNLNGQRVKTWDFRQQEAGSYQQSWDGTADNGRKLSAGIYLIRLRSGKNVQTREISLIE